MSYAEFSGLQLYKVRRGGLLLLLQLLLILHT